jgi:protein-disulfide isomerase
MMSKQKAQARAAAAAKIAAEAKRRERRNTILKIAAVVAAMAVIVVVGVIAGTHKGGGNSADKASQPAPAAGESKYSLTVGEKTAPHQVIIYEDFLCPYCDQFELASSAQLAQLAAQGKVYLDYRPFHFLPENYSQEALNAFAVVLTTSGPDVAKKFHDLLYENQPSEEGPFPAMSKLVDLAVQAGADESKVKAGIEDTSSQKSWVDGADTVGNDEAKIQGTPTIMLDGKEFQQGSTVQELAANLVKAVS